MRFIDGLPNNLKSILLKNPVCFDYVLRTCIGIFGGIQSKNQFSNGVFYGVGANSMCFVVILDCIVPINFHEDNIIYYTAKIKNIMKNPGPN